jgi:hypothetical protein
MTSNTINTKRRMPMNLEDIWAIFLHQLTLNINFISIKKNVYSGLPFLYIETIDSQVEKEEVEGTIQMASALSMRGKRLHSETIFVRKDGNTYVYRHRFYVPQEKMFCCGNLCSDCIRLR